MKQTIVLLILEGWGVGEKNRSNPIYIANLPFFKKIEKEFPHTALKASGIAVGLPWEEKGNSEVGYLCLGTGKIIYQHYPRISLAIKNKTFFENQVLINAFNHSKKYSSAVHLVGLLTAGYSCSHMDHLTALLHLAKQQQVNSVYLHLFTDGIDSPPKSAKQLLIKLKRILEQEKLPGEIASLSGRYYALDQSENWERTERVYKILIGETKKSDLTPEQLIDNIYSRNLSDQFVPPTLLKQPVKENDAIIFFNFREDVSRQITFPFALPDYCPIKTKKIDSLKVVTFTEYDKRFNLPVVFPPQQIKNPLSKILADHNKIQLKITESQKYDNLAVFFNGYIRKPFANEYRITIPSLDVPRPQEFPQLRANEITNRVISSIKERIYDFIVANYANPDIIGHSGDFKAGIEVAKIIDQQLSKIYQEVIEKENTIMLITSDHGNMEKMRDPFTGVPLTDHTTNPVPFYLIGKRFKTETAAGETRISGIISDVVPTILELMHIPVPEDMDGTSLLSTLI